MENRKRDSSTDLYLLELAVRFVGIVSRPTELLSLLQRVLLERSFAVAKVLFAKGFRSVAAKVTFSSLAVLLLFSTVLTRSSFAKMTFFRSAEQLLITG